MFKAIPYKTKQLLLVLIKLGLVVAAFYYLYLQLFHNKDLTVDGFADHVMTNSSLSMNAACILAVLSVLNWIFEILKWQTLVGTISKIPFKEAASQSLGAFTASLWTPNRIGDYGAKAMYYQGHLRKKIMFLNLLSNSAQMGITLLFGMMGLGYIVLKFQPRLNYNGLLVIVVLFVLAITFLVWAVKAPWLKQRKHRFKRLLGFIKTFSNKILLHTVGCSLLRYLIFSFQFYYLLLLFGNDFPYFIGMAAISCMYLLASIIPSVVIFDVVVKGGVAVYVFGLIGVTEAVVLSIVTCMWVLNVVLPSMIGAYHVLAFKLPKPIS